MTATTEGLRCPGCHTRAPLATPSPGWAWGPLRWLSPAREVQEPSHKGHVTGGHPTCPPLQEEFPVREDLSDDTDEDARPAQPPPPSKPPVSSFRLKNDSDLFGLGLEETGHKEISDEGS